MELDYTMYAVGAVVMILGVVGPLVYLSYSNLKVIKFN